MKILDIGANNGWWYRRTVKQYPNAEFTLIEANPYMEDAIKECGQPYHMVCLSDTKKEVDFYLIKSDITTTGASYYRENTEHFSDDNLHIVKLTTTTLDTLFPDESFDLIKMDVQGAEVDIIKGGKLLISKASQIILEVPLEHVEYNLGAPNRKEYFDAMFSLGFTNYEILEDIHGLQQDILFTR